MAGPINYPRKRALFPGRRRRLHGLQRADFHERFIKNHVTLVGCLARRRRLFGKAY
ncbi:MAG: hypothetical protein ACLUEQ_04850 [Cloacibacillus evryensis]